MDDKKVVRFPQPTRPSLVDADKYAQTFKLVEAIAMPLTEYERQRKRIAKELNWRPSFWTKSRGRLVTISRPAPGGRITPNPEN